MALAQLIDESTGQAYTPPDTSSQLDATRSINLGGGINWADVINRGGVTGDSGGAQPGQPPYTNPTTETAMNPPAPAPTRYQYMEGVDTGKLNDPSVTSPKYIAARILASGGTVAQAAAAVGGTVIDATRFRLPTGEIIDTRRDSEGANVLQWLVEGGGGSGSGGSGAGGTSGGAQGLARTGTGGTTTGVGSVQGNNVFTDPATTDWETLLRALVDKLNNPQPTWTPAQLDLQQTQALDPLERAHQAQRQNTALQLAQRGITPGSGIYESTMRNVDNQFAALRAQTQGNFATQAINRDDQVFNNNETRATNAVNMLRQIPALADARLAAAQGSIQQNNPYQLLALQNQIQNQQFNAGQQQQQNMQDFWTQLAIALSQAFG